MEKSIIFRNDDVCIDFDYKKYKDVQELFNQFGIKETYAVVPFGKCIYTPNAHLLSKQELIDILGNKPITDDDSACEFIRNSLRQGHQIGLHGWQHILLDQYSFKEQLTGISSGKELLEKEFNTKIKYFVPPFNSYNDDTVKVCEMLGLHILGRNQNQLEWLARDNADFTGDDHCWYHSWRFNDLNILKKWLQQHYNQQKS